MEEYTIDEGKIVEKTEEEKQIELFVSLMKAKKELEDANRNFEYAEEELIDYYTYQIKSAHAKYDYLVKKAKDQGLALDMTKQIEIKYNRAI